MTPDRDQPEWVLFYVAVMFGAWVAFMSVLLLI